MSNIHKILHNAHILVLQRIGYHLHISSFYIFLCGEERHAKNLLTLLLLRKLKKCRGLSDLRRFTRIMLSMAEATDVIIF